MVTGCGADARSATPAAPVPTTPPAPSFLPRLVPAAVSAAPAAGSTAAGRTTPTGSAVAGDTDPVPAVPRGSKVVFYGDSYTSAVSATTSAHGYAELTSQAFGWRPTIIGWPGSGFTVPGRADAGTYAARFRNELVPQLGGARLIVVQGGLNDVDATAAGTAATAFYAELHRVAPTIPVVFFGEVNFLATPTANEVRVNAALAQAAERSGVPAVLPVDQHWITASNAHHYFRGGDVHPNDAGYAYLAARLEQSLRGLGA